MPAAFPSPINLSPSQANSPCAELGSGARSASRSSAGASRWERGKERSTAAPRAPGGTRSGTPGAPRSRAPTDGPARPLLSRVLKAAARPGRSSDGAGSGGTRRDAGPEPGTSPPRSPGEPPALPAGRRGGSCSAAPTARFHALFFPDLLLVTGDSMRSPLSGTFPAAPRPGAVQSRPDRPPRPPPHSPRPHGAAPRFAPCAPPQPRRLRGSSRSWLAPLPASAPAQTPVSAPEYFTVGEQEGGETA